MSAPIIAAITALPSTSRQSVSRRHLVVHDPGLAPVLGIHHAAHVGIDDPGHVGGRPPACGDQARGADVERQHRPAHEGAPCGAVLADHVEAERAAHRAAGAVDAKQKRALIWMAPLRASSTSAAT